MLYITGERDRLEDLMNQEKYPGTIQAYQAEIRKRNPHLSGIGSSSYLPHYTPVILVFDPFKDTQKLICRDLHVFSLEERKRLHQMQVSGFDYLTNIVMQDIVEEAQAYSSRFREFYDQPIISTPWSVLNHSLTNASIPDILSEFSIYTSQTIKHSGRLIYYDELYHNLMMRDDLSRRLLLLKGRSNSRSLISQRAAIEKQIKELTRKIKDLLNIKVDQKTAKYLSSFGLDEIKKMKTGSYSMKMARKGKLVATQLDLLNKSGVSMLRKLVSKLKVIGDHAGKISFALGVGAVAYDVGQAYYKKTDITRAFLTGSTGILTSYAISSSIALSSLGNTMISGGLVIGGLSGEAALAGSSALLYTPAGVIVLIVVGAAGVGYVSYKASERVGELWDVYGHEISQKVSEVADQVMKDIAHAWNSSQQWIVDFYGASR